MSKESFLLFIDKARVVILGIFALIFPLFFMTLTTDPFLIPKELLLTAVVLLSLILWGIKMVMTEKVTLRRTPFDLPVLLFIFAILLSAVFAVNRADSLIASIPVALAGLSVFIVVNTIKKQNTIVFFLTALLLGSAAASVWAIFSYFKVYPLFFSYTHVQSFSAFGGLLDQALYFALLLPVGIYFAFPITRGKTNNQTVTFAALSALTAAGLLVTLLELVTIQKPVLLPFETGFQTAFAAISQDAGRIAQGFLFGSGFGNFAAVFTRFKQASFNANPNWFTAFNQSSSFILELLATTGILGFLSFLFLLFRAVSVPRLKKKNPLYYGLLLGAAVSLILPFTFVEVVLLFLLIGAFAAVQGLKDEKEYFDVELKFVALKKGFVAFQQVNVPSVEKHEYNRPTAIIVGIIVALIVGVVGWYGSLFLLSDMDFQQSVAFANANNGTGTYTKQVQGISTFPYRSAYYRVFSQTNIALANSLESAQPKGSSPSAQVQNTILSLIQQGISTGKQATALAPQTVSNWQNLSSVYRALIGLGQGADSFAIQAAQQAVILDPTNPQEFLALGGIYYQLSQWDNAITAFQQAISLKQDYANAYFNLGNAYEQKGDYQNAMNAFQAVKSLVASDKNATKTINAAISELQGKMGTQASQTTEPKVTPAPQGGAQQPLNLSGQAAGPTPSVNSGQAAGQAATPTTSEHPSPVPPAPAQ